MPYESARIEHSPKNSPPTVQERRLKQMAENILGRVRGKKLHRIDMHFKIEKSFDGYIGRKAHMMIIENFKVQSIFAYFFLKYLV